MALTSCNLLPNLDIPLLASAEGIRRAGLKCATSPSCVSASSVEAISSRYTGSDVRTRKMPSITSSLTSGRLGGRGGGAGLLERPGLDQSSPDTAPRTEEGGEMGKSAQKVRLGGGDRFRVLLLDHERHTEAQVAKVIPSVVPSVSPDEARKCFYESKEFGVGLVTIAVKEHAEFYVQMLVRYGLRSSMEQDSSIA